MGQQVTLPIAMGDASFESHGTRKTRDLPIIELLFNTEGCSRVYKDQGSSYIFLVLVAHREGVQHVSTLGLLGIQGTNKTMILSMGIVNCRMQQHKAQGMEIELVQAENAVEQPGKGSGRLWLGCTIIGCTSRMSLYQSVLPKGRV
ncbi:hypothetical protein K492DRAFT_200163 [Lichtheimia hyalospora FSU 10163]|nr:hypothetical protein K492DRAFT_200163 [Lichtheimia hyalospora FSU 10163]